MAAAQKPIWPRVPSGFVKGQLVAHELIGLTLAAVMYLVCISGAIAVFYAEYERWEKPGVPEMAYASPEAVGRAAAYARQQIAESGATPTDVFIINPSAEMPRLVVDYEAEPHGETMAFDETGAYAGEAGHDLTHFLVGLHYALNLPYQIGFVIIGTLGVLLTALIVGGALALPRMFRDAFTLRLDGGRRMSRVDLHNRLAVWGLPFHFIVAVSGAVMGVALITISIAGPVMFNGDSLRASAEMYGDYEALSAQAAEAGAPSADVPEAHIVAALETLARERPDNPPIYMGISNYGTPNEFVSIGAGHGSRLIYSETYYFDSAGGLMSSAGYADGHISQQIAASMFRVHAGAFGGPWVQWLYAILGLGLSFICTTGVDIWLAKAAARGRTYDRVQSAWTSFVWATPAMIALACTINLIADTDPIPVFWIGLAVLSLAGVWTPQRFAHWLGPLLAGIAALSLPIFHAARFGADAFTHAGLSVNAGVATCAIAMIALALRNLKRQAAAPAAEPLPATS